MTLPSTTIDFGTGIGLPGSDPLFNSIVTRARFLNYETIEESHTQLWPIRRACNILPYLAFEKGADFNPGEDGLDELKKEIERIINGSDRVPFRGKVWAKRPLSFKQVLVQAVSEAEAYGGGAIVLDIEMVELGTSQSIATVFVP